MPCYKPLTVYTKPGGGITFSKGESLAGITTKIPCGGCIGCRIETSKMWAVRCSHEASLYEENEFITLTYSQKYLPKNGSLNKKHFQDFMKRLRKKFTGRKIRFYHCGEYGPKLKRPHYHAIIFNLKFPDRKFWKHTAKGEKIYRSAILEKLWPFGYSSTGEVTYQSSAYVARYIMKKINGDQAKEHYQKVDKKTGEISYLQTEYTIMSNRPGIANEWFKQFSSDIFPHDFAVLQNGKKTKTPAYYLL